jgi:hypothetical protein
MLMPNHPLMGAVVMAVPTLVISTGMTLFQRLRSGILYLFAVKRKIMLSYLQRRCCRVR